MRHDTAAGANGHSNFWLKVNSTSFSPPLGVTGDRLAFVLRVHRVNHARLFDQVRVHRIAIAEHQALQPQFLFEVGHNLVHHMSSAGTAGTVWEWVRRPARAWESARHAG